MEPITSISSGVMGDPSRDEYLTEFGKATLKDRYLFTGETYQDLFVRVAKAYASGEEHASRLYDYMSKGWFMPATPILSNGGTNRGLPISCFLNSVEDSLEGIEGTWSENVWLAARGGGIGTYWGEVREKGDIVNEVGYTSGIIPFIKVQDSLTLAISQGSLRRGSAAVYLDISHPEIEEFLIFRRVTGDDVNRRGRNIHQGVVLSDAFMEAARTNSDFDLIGPRHGRVVKTVKARELLNKIIDMRMETGEPYILFGDTVSRSRPEVYKRNNLLVRQSNLCSEIMLSTGRDYNNKPRTAVCCLSSVNIEKYDDWSRDDDFVLDVMEFLDNVLQDFIDRTEGVHGFENARYSAMMERSVGLGVMGWHSFLQAKRIPFESVMAKVWNKKIFTYLRDRADNASQYLAVIRGACPDAQRAGLMERFSHKMAVAPTSSISIICGGVSPGIEPLPGNAYTQKTLSGSIPVKNPQLQSYLEEIGYNDDDTWTSIIVNKGSVQHLEFLDQHHKDVFKTAFEIDQSWLIEQSNDRAESIDQGQSVNLFNYGDTDKGVLLKQIFKAWRGGSKSLYYQRSLAAQRASVVSTMSTSNNLSADECLACQ